MIVFQLSGHHHATDEENEHESTQEMSDRSIFHAEFSNAAFNNGTTEESKQGADNSDSQTKIIEF